MEENVIEVKNGFKKYPTSDYILKGVDMHISKGAIYSLLGPSGCGKTTLLSCIVGLQELSSGFINMESIKSPKDFGYMPQDIALQTVCTINETLFMYGLMFGMNQKEIAERSEHLTELLNLPDRNMPVGLLSGGQQRRISFAVSLMHNPDTLLLDEPTVGLDPLLRLSIWKYLQDASKKENKTIIITTHYIEEARHSDKVGLMRNGVILTEGDPGKIMDKYHTTNLEDAFIQLCLDRNSKDISENPHPKKSKDPKSTYTLENEYFKFNHFKSQVYKDYLWTKRNLLLMMVLLMLPSSQSFLFCWTFGRYPNDFKVGLYSEESTASNTICLPHTYLRYFDEEYGGMNCSMKRSLSCDYLQRLQSRFDMVLYDDLDTALLDTINNKIWGVVHINSNFTEAVITRIVEGLWTDNDVLSTATIDVRLDMTNFIVGHHIKSKLVELLRKTVEFVIKSCHLKELSTSPLRIIDKFYEGSESLGSDSETVGFLVGFTFYFALMFTASALSFEKKQGVINRNKVIGTTTLEVVFGHLVIQLIVLTIQKAIMIVILYGVFDHKMNGSIFNVMLGLFLAETVGISLGMLLANIFEAAILLNATIVFSTLSIFLLGGAIWPQEGFHWLMNIYKWAVPAQPVISSLRDVIIKNKSITNPDVYQGYLNCVLWVVLISFLTYIVNKFKNKS